MMRLKWIVTIIFCFCLFGARAQNKQLSQGNRFYGEGKYKEAATAYQEALGKRPNYVPGMFNLGNAMFQQKNFEGSRKLMEETLKHTPEKKIKSGAHYNIGNTYMKEQKWQEAVEAYKQTLRLNPQDEEAKYNLSYALEMMKKQEGGGGKNDNKKDQNKDKDQKDQEDQKKDQQMEDQKDKEQQKEDQKNEKKNQEQKPQPGKLSEQQAEQLLNALSQEEKKLHDKKEKGKAVKVKMDKDW
jgi:Ca-activated chloride channel homolog